jgi:hypothetical protein
LHCFKFVHKKKLLPPHCFGLQHCFSLFLHLKNDMLC